MAEKTLPVELTQDEVVERALSLARVVRERERVEEEHLLRGREARSELKRLAVEARDLARAVEERSEERPVQMELVFDRPAARVVEVRLDTGTPVSVRAMTAAEVEACDAGDLEVGEVPADAVEAVNTLAAAADLDRRRAEFNLGAWAAGHLTDKTVARLVEAGLCEVDSLLAADPKVVAKTAGISKAKARELLDALAESFVSAPPPRVVAEAWEAGSDVQ